MSIPSQGITVSNFPRIAPKLTTAGEALPHQDLGRAPEPVAPAAPGEMVTLSVALRTPRPGSDMEQMVEGLQANGLVSEARSDSAPSAASMMASAVVKELTTGAGPLDVQVNGHGAIALLEEPALSPSSAHSQHGFSLKQEALLAGHIGTEIIEKLGHQAHHAASHASEAAHAAAQMAEAAHAVETAHGVAEPALSVGKEVAHHLSTGLEVALGVGAVGAGILAVPITLSGVKELKAGLKEKDADKILEGVGSLAVGTRSAGTAAVMAGMLTTSEVVTQVAGVAAQTLTPLGIVHAGVDTVLGVRDIAKGKVTEGLLKIGTGAAIGAAAIVGGLPLTIAALGMLGVKTGHKIYQHVQEKKQAAHEVAP